MKYIANLIARIMGYNKPKIKRDDEILGIGAITVLPKSIDRIVNEAKPRKIEFSKNNTYNPVTGRDDLF